jgi:adenylate kinase family enzyme
MRVVFLIGAPLSGKSTQAALLYEKYAQLFNSRFSIDDWLQEMAASNCDLGKYILSNTSYDAIEGLLTHKLYNLITDKEGFVIDGYPRTAGQASQLPLIAHGNEVMVIELMRAPQPTNTTDNAIQSRMQFYNMHMQQIRQILQGLHPRIWQGVDGNGSIENVHARIVALVTGDSSLPRLPIQTPPARVINAQISYAFPLDAAVVIQMTLRLAQCPRLKRNFCGSYPVSLERSHLESLTRFPYMVSLKIDGIRMFAVTWRNKVWFVNRKMDVFEGPTCLAEDETLLDCEYVPQLNRFCVCDCIAVRGEYVGNHSLLERVKLASAVGKKLNTFFRPQEFVPFEQLAILWKKGEEMKKHIPLDGLIFTPGQAALRLGIDYKLFK